MKFLKLISVVTCTMILIGATGYLLSIGIVALTENGGSWQALAQMPGANQASRPFWPARLMAFLGHDPIL